MQRAVLSLRFEATTWAVGFVRHDKRLRYNVAPAMEFAFSRGCGRKPRELMTPPKHEGVFLCSVIFW